MSVIVMPMRVNYAGRVLALNPDKGRFFQTGGFRLTPSRPASVVPPDAFMDSIHLAVLSGSLLDVTDNPGAIRTENAELSKADEQETGMRAFVVTRVENGSRNVSVVVPRDEEELQRFEQEIRETGTLDLSRIPEAESRPAMSASRIQVTPWEESGDLQHGRDSGNQSDSLCN